MHAPICCDFSPPHCLHFLGWRGFSVGSNLLYICWCWLIEMCVGVTCCVMLIGKCIEKHAHIQRIVCNDGDANAHTQFRTQWQNINYMNIFNSYEYANCLQEKEWKWTASIGRKIKWITRLQNNWAFTNTGGSFFDCSRDCNQIEWYLIWGNWK